MQEALRRIDADLSRRGFLTAMAAAAASVGLTGDALAQAAAPPAATLFTNVNVFDGKSPKRAMGMTVLVEQGKISWIRPGKVAGPAGATVIDGGGRTLMPGLIDNHMHIFISA
ncbi:MAG: amidohydrolase family protein, partial [Bosea sp. (in: a-proteobacteria)]